MNFSIDFHKMKLMADHGDAIRYQLECFDISCSLEISKELFENSSEVGIYIKSKEKE